MRHIDGAMGTDEVTIRGASEDDRDAILAVTLAAYDQYASVMPASFWPPYREHLVASLTEEGPAERIVAELGGALIGCVQLYPAESRAYAGVASAATWPEIRLLAVAPAARGRGVGAALMDECLRRARASGAAMVGLHTMDVMVDAVRMYERMGFVRAPEGDFSPFGGIIVKGYRRAP